MTKDNEAAGAEGNFLDRAAYHDGRLDGLTAATNAFLAAMKEIEDLGPMPSASDPGAKVLVYQVRVATACGATFRRLGEELNRLTAAASEEREVLMRDLAMIQGERMN
jgi:hypothetical protein